MDLVYAQKTEEVVEILQKLKNLSLAFKEKVVADASQPALIDGSQKYEGIEDMRSYLELLDHEKGQWYYCNC